MVEFPTSFSQQTGPRAASPKANCRPGPSVRPGCSLLGLGLVNAKQSVAVSPGRPSVPHFYSQEPLINAGLVNR